MKNLAQKTHQEVTRFCHEMAEKEQRGYAQAAWFEQNGEKEIEKILEDERLDTWASQAKNLGYTENDVVVKPYISTHAEWYNWTSFSLEIPNYGEYEYNLEKISFPQNSELPKDFVAPFIERERREAAEKAEIAEKAEKAEKEREKAEIDEWIGKYGSEELRHAVETGGNYQRRYVFERTTKELPGFQVDYENLAYWKRQKYPSRRAREQAESLMDQGYGVSIVWLIHPTNKSYNFRSCEAIVVRDYLGKYDLLKEVQIRIPNKK